MPTISVIIVTHNSGAVLPHCLRALARQTLAVCEIILVDSGSDDLFFLNTLPERENIQVITTNNVGFAQANNLGFARIRPDTDFVLFLNPDALLAPDCLATALAVSQEYPQAGIISGKLQGYDIEQGRATGRLDSTGIFRKWYGRWFDRGQGEKDRGEYDAPSFVPALCGALLLCRMDALRALPGPPFDPDFFLYKEDIELSLRLRKAGWKLLYHPRISAFHGRGWNRKRETIPLALRKMAAVSEITLYTKHPSPCMLWALAKYLLVRLLAL